MFSRLIQASFILLLIISLSGIVYGNEALPKGIAETLGVSVDTGTRFEIIYEYQPTASDKARPDAEYHRIITKVSYAHGGGDVGLWKIEFVEGYSASKHLVHIYLDSDNDILTGRQHKRSDGSYADWQGVDHLLTLDNTTDEWVIRRREYTPSGSVSDPVDNLPVYAAEGNTVYCRETISKNKDGVKLVFRGRVVSQIPGKVVNSSPWLNINAKAYSEYDSSEDPGILAYPNPFLDKVQITWSSEEVGTIRVMIFDVKGNTVWDESQNFEAGYQSIYWDGRDKDGTSLPGGIYHCLVITGDNRDAKPLFRGILVKAD